MEKIKKGFRRNPSPEEVKRQEVLEEMKIVQSLVRLGKEEEASMIIGRKVLTFDKVIKEVEKNTKLGKIIVRDLLKASEELKMDIKSFLRLGLKKLLGEG